MKGNSNKNNGRRGSATPPNDKINGGQATQHVNPNAQTSEAGPSTSRRGRYPARLNLVQRKQQSNPPTPINGSTSSSPRGSKRKSPQEEEHVCESPKKAKTGSQANTPTTVKGKGKWKGKGKAKETRSPTRSQPPRSAKRVASPRTPTPGVSSTAGPEVGNQPESSATAAARTKTVTETGVGAKPEGQEQNEEQNAVVLQDGQAQQNTPIQQNATVQQNAAPVQQNAAPVQQNAPVHVVRPPTPRNGGPPPIAAAAAAMAPIAPPPAPAAVPPVIPAALPAAPPGFNRECGHHERCYGHPPWEYICDNCRLGVCKRHSEFCEGKPTSCSKNRNVRMKKHH